jgi:hypothetical protein
LPTQQPRVVLPFRAQRLPADPSTNEHPLCTKAAPTEFCRGMSTSPIFKEPIYISDRTSGLLRCGYWDTNPAPVDSVLLRRASVEPDKPLSWRSGSTGQHVADGECRSLMSRLVVSFPGCADRLEDVAHFQFREGRRLVSAVVSESSICGRPFGSPLTPTARTLPYEYSNLQSDWLAVAANWRNVARKPFPRTGHPG